VTIEYSNRQANHNLRTPVQRLAEYNSKYQGPYEVELINTNLARVYLMYPKIATPQNWCYGGLRRLPINFGLNESDANIFEQQKPSPTEYARLYNYQEQAILKELRVLGIFESGIKHSLINFAIDKGLLEKVITNIKSDNNESHESKLINMTLANENLNTFFTSKVCGGRSVFVANDSDAESEIKEAILAEDKKVLGQIFKPLAERLNKLNGAVKLTPDFGRNAFIAETMSEWTPHVLGVPYDRGGASGKSTYTTAGIIKAINLLIRAHSLDKRSPVTIIGHKGALGSSILHEIKARFSDIAVTDISHREGDPLPEDCELIKSEQWKIPDKALERGGLIITAALRNELENSNYNLIPNDTIILLAQNHSINFGGRGVGLVDDLSKRGILVIPGQLLTLAGAMTARLEWAWRTYNNIEDAKSEVDEVFYFPKAIAQYFSEAIIEILMNDIVMNKNYNSPLQAVKELVGFSGNSQVKKPWEA
jgi:hypothetical protein